MEIYTVVVQYSLLFPMNQYKRVVVLERYNHETLALRSGTPVDLQLTPGKWVGP